MDLREDSRFRGMKPFERKIWLSSPTMHGEELLYMKEAYETNWMSTVGENLDAIEAGMTKRLGIACGVALSSGTAALHLAVKAAAERIYHSSTGISTPDGMGRGGAWFGRRVFCSDLTFGATVNPIVYEGGEAVFVDAEEDTWNMDPNALERAFELYPEVKLVVLVHLYGTPGKVDEIKKICKDHGALLIEDAAESLGAVYQGKETGTFGDYNIISFNGNKMITGSSGGMLLTEDMKGADQCRKWSTQSREEAAWYQHEELGYNYRMSNVIAGVIRGQMLYLEEHIERKREIYERYKQGLKDVPVKMNPYDEKKSEPNFWLSCMTIDQEAMCEQVRGEREESYIPSKGKTCPGEILEALRMFHAEGRPIWKPMHMQPIYRNHGFITREGMGRRRTNAYIASAKGRDVGADLFHRGVCLPSDIKMTREEQDGVIEIVRRCFG